MIPDQILIAARRVTFFVSVASSLVSARGVAQDADPLPTTPPPDSVRFPNTMAGELTPGRGFDVIKTRAGSLNISVYGLFRYVNQMPQGQTFTDHLGREREVNPRNDLNWHRSFVWLTGFIYDPKFRYNISIWSLPTTQQNLIFGNLQYTVANWLTAGVGIGPNRTARSVQGAFPFFAGTDRLMGEEFFRGGFSSGVWVTGDVIPRLNYSFSITNNLSQLGVIQANDTRDMVYSGALRWQPTTGEFGPRNGFGDLEHHERLATQFGASAANSRESRYAPLDQPPNATQIKLSDAVNPFEAGALAESVTVKSLDYTELALDAGVKYKGFSLMTEYYFRTLHNFEATGPLPLSSIHDHGLMVQTSYMIVPKTLDLYVVGSYIFDDFKRYPWEVGGGLSFYPVHSRSWRTNAHILHVNESAASSLFGYYQPGMTGTVFSLSMDILM
jgi:hypothetical protein